MWYSPNHIISAFNRTSMESKLIIVRVIAFIVIYTFNRTSMESKPCSACYCDVACCLLIEPVWNRNDLDPDFRKTTLPAFNRTSMESKLIMSCTDRSDVLPFNRTSMESKLLTNNQKRSVLKTTFNRTSMESKHECRYFDECGRFFF